MFNLNKLYCFIFIRQKTRMKILNKLFIVFLPFFFNSCTKDAYVSTAAPVNQDQAKRASTIRSNDVVSWLQSKARTSPKPEAINQVLDNLLLPELYAENYNNKENLVIIPINKQKTGSQAGNLTTSALEFLLMVEDDKGKLRAGDIACFYPKDQSITTVPGGFFKAFFEDQKLLADGKFRLKNMEGAYQFEMYFDKGKPVEFKERRPKAPIAYNIKDMDCVDWYLVTTYYKDHGDTNIVWEYLYSNSATVGE